MIPVTSPEIRRDAQVAEVRHQTGQMSLFLQKLGVTETNPRFELPNFKLEGFSYPFSRPDESPKVYTVTPNLNFRISNQDGNNQLTASFELYALPINSTQEFQQRFKEALKRDTAFEIAGTNIQKVDPDHSSLVGESHRIQTRGRSGLVVTTTSTPRGELRSIQVTNNFMVDSPDFLEQVSGYEDFLDRFRNVLTPGSNSQTESPHTTVDILNLSQKWLSGATRKIDGDLGIYDLGLETKLAEFDKLPLITVRDAFSESAPNIDPRQQFQI